MKPDAVPASWGWWLSLPYPARSILQRWRSLIGMVIGVGIALGIGMLMLGVSKASAVMFTGDFVDSGVDIYVLTRGGILVPLLPGDAPGTIDRGRQLLSHIRFTEGVQEAVGFRAWSLERDRPGPHRSDEPTELLSVVGIDGDATKIPGAVVVQEGRWLRRGDELVVGARLSRESGFRLDQIVRLSGRELRIVGIGRLRGAGFSGSSLAYLDMQTLRPRLGGGDIFETIMVDTSAPELLSQRLLALGDVRVVDRLGAIAEGDAAMASDRVAHWLFIGLTLAIAALFVGNMLGRSVARRRSDFATMRAIGIPDGTLRMVVIGEAMLVTAPAALIGVLISSLLGHGINVALAPVYGLESFYSADAALFAAVLAMAVGVGMLAGFVPAHQATRVDPQEVLREA
ncbi:MAG: ABC transporter permease [Chloroflexota bacterium]